MINSSKEGTAQPGTRQLVHQRDIKARGYCCDDGLWDIEAILTDTKSYAFANIDRGDVPVGEPLHRMRVCLRVDDGYVIRAVEAETLYAPFALCPAITSAYQSLVGLRIAAGFTRAVRQAVGGVHGCTHLNEIVRILATVAVQTISPRARDFLGEEKASAVLPPSDEPMPETLRRSCHAFADDSPVSARVFAPRADTD